MYQYSITMYQCKKHKARLLRRFARAEWWAGPHV